MLIVGNIPQIAAQAWQPIYPAIYPDDGELSGWFIPGLIIGASSLIGGGTLWVMHEKHTEKEMYYACMEKAVAEMNMNAEEAKIFCSPDVKPKKALFDFDFGLNASTIAVGAGAIFGLWYMTKLLSTAMK